MMQFLVLICPSCERPEGIYVPDDEFLKALIRAGVDKDGDGVISAAEAEAVHSIIITTEEITDMTGIEQFVNLHTLIYSHDEYEYRPLYPQKEFKRLENLSLSENTKLKYLDIRNNFLKELDLSENKDLRYLSCGGNELTVLDVSENSMLDTLICWHPMGVDWPYAFIRLNTLVLSTHDSLKYCDCSENEISKIDVSKCPTLTYLNCQDNKEMASLEVASISGLKYINCGNYGWRFRGELGILTSLDISGATELEVLICNYSSVTELNISKNTSLQSIDLAFMPSLYKVCVWTWPFPPGNVTVNTEESPNMYFTTECSK